MHLFTASTLGGALNTASLASSVKLSLRRHHTFGNQHIFGRSIGPGRQHLIAQASSSPSEEDDKLKFALAPSKPTSAVGEMVAYYLQMQPHLFRTAVETEFEKIKEGREAASSSSSSSSDSEQTATPTTPETLDLVLSKRMAEVRHMEERTTIEDLMYVCILEKFQGIGVDLLPNVAPVPETMTTLNALTEGVHTKEALDMVKEHVLSVLGPASMALANTRIKMSKLQAAQVYAASIMFGYFLRRVDARFQLAKTVGMVPESPEDAVARLEKLFAMSDESTMEATSDDESTTTTSSSSASASSSSSATSNNTNNVVKRERGALRRYVESFDQETMMATTRLVTAEGSALVERQTKALFGDVKALQTQMQEAVGSDAVSVEELMERVQQAVAAESVEIVDITVGTQRRAVLEAVAYGCFLRDVECWVGREYALLTPAMKNQL